MGEASAAFGGGQGASAAALSLRLIQDGLHGVKHIPSWDAIHGERCWFVVGDQLPRGKWLSSQRVLARRGWRPSNIGRSEECHARGPKQCCQMTGSGVVADNHGRVLYGRQGGAEAVLTDHSRPENVFRHCTQAGLFIGRSQEHDGMTRGLELLSKRYEA